MRFSLRLRASLTAFLLIAATVVAARAEEPAASPAALDSSNSDANAAPTRGPDPTVEEILVSGTSVTSSVNEARFSESIVDVLSAEDFKTTGDSNVVDALSRVTGVTTVGDKYVYVRGLGERYSQTLFNGALLPSPDPFRRVLPLDLFPSSAMDQLSVQKTYAPYLPADFAGGSVQLSTRGVPAEREASMTLKLKGNSETTFQERPWYQGGSGTDSLGYDGGFRGLPKIARDLDPGNRDEAVVQQAGLSLHRRFAQKDELLPPGYGMDLSYANNWKTHAGDLGLVMATEADNNWHYRRESRINYGSYRPAIISDFTSQTRTDHETQYTGLGSGTWKPAESQLLRATIFYSHLTDDEFDDADPKATYCGDYEQTPDQCFYQKGLFAEWREQALVTSQLSGSHSLDAFVRDLGFDWGVTFSNAKQSIPDSRDYTFRYNGYPPTPGTETLQLDDGNVRRWEDLNDDAWDTFGAFTLPVKWSEKFLSTLKAGTKYNNKQRDKKFHQFRYVSRAETDLTGMTIDEIFADENINPNYWRLVQEQFPANSYTAEEEIIAGFFQADTELGSMFRWMAGFRYERYKQPTTLSSGEHTVLEDDDFYPATELTWLIRDDLQLRGAFSRTVNRPDLLERIDRARFRNPENGYIYTGDSRLVPATLMNYDLRLEWYHGLGDSVEAAGFYKDIKDPIEEVIFQFGDRSWRNADDATLYGVEVAAQQNLAPLGRWADDFTVRGNAAWIKSKATPASTDLVFTNPTHPLQGQSEWVMNFQITHAYIPWDMQTTLAFNWVSERLSAVGADPLPDAYEQPTPSLDFTLRKGFEMFGQPLRFTFKARNLINDTYEETRAGSPILSYKDGVDFSFEIGKDF